jgi:uncharacterized protein YuzE
MEKKQIKNLTDKIQYSYDKAADVLYISFGKPRKALCVQKEEGILFRVDPFKDKVVGITVISYKERFDHLSKQKILKFAENKLSEF